MEGNDTFKLPEALTIAQMALFKSELLTLVEQDGDVSLDASALQRVDAAGLQWLLVLKRALQAHDHELHWKNVSDAFADTAHRGGFGAVLEGG